MLLKFLWVLDLAEPITDIHYHSGNSIDSVKWPVVLLLASSITDAVHSNYTPLPSIEELMELVAARKDCSKIYLADGYYNIRIKES